MEKCLYCYKPLKPGQIDYHPTCAKKLFGTKEAPVLPYVRKEIGDLAKRLCALRPPSLVFRQNSLSM